MTLNLFSPFNENGYVTQVKNYNITGIALGQYTGADQLINPSTWTTSYPTLGHNGGGVKIVFMKVHNFGSDPMRLMFFRERGKYDSLFWQGVVPSFGDSIICTPDAPMNTTTQTAVRSEINVFAFMSGYTGTSLQMSITTTYQWSR